MQTKSKDIEIISQNLSELKKRRDLIARETSVLIELLIKSNGITGSEENLLQMENYEIFSSNKLAVISYVKNNYNDTAFLRFSELFHTTKVSYGINFEEVCERVYNGVCDYCILPIESVAGGKLFSFYSLIDKYDLQIFAVCDIDEASSSKRTRYALLTRAPLICADDEKRHYFEFSLIKDDSYLLSDILDAADTVGARLYRIDSIPVPYDDLTFRIYHVFEADSNAFLALKTYLDYKYPQQKTVGHYLLLE